MVQDQIPMEEDPYHQEPHSPFVEIVEKPKVDTIDNECATYLREFESETVSQYYKTSLEFWKDHTTQFPTIAKMVRKYLPLPGSSSPAERVVNLINRQRRPERGQLDHKTVEDLVMMTALEKFDEYINN